MAVTDGHFFRVDGFVKVELFNVALLVADERVAVGKGPALDVLAGKTQSISFVEQRGEC
jgi:hypothetical protein